MVNPYGLGEIAKAGSGGMGQNTRAKGDALCRIFDRHLACVEKLAADLATARTEVERLRRLLKQLLQHRAYLYVAQPTDYICSHCGGQWEMSDQERHNDNCPVPLAEAEVGVPSGTAAMRRTMLIDIGVIDQ